MSSLKSHSLCQNSKVAATQSLTKFRYRAARAAVGFSLSQGPKIHYCSPLQLQADLAPGERKSLPREDILSSCSCRTEVPILSRHVSHHLGTTFILKVMHCFSFKGSSILIWWPSSAKMDEDLDFVKEIDGINQPTS